MVSTSDGALRPNVQAQPQPLAAGSRLQSGLSIFIAQSKTQGAVAVGSSTVLGDCLQLIKAIFSEVNPSQNATNHNRQD